MALKLTCVCGAKGKFKDRNHAVEAGWTIVKAATSRAGISFSNCPDCLSTEMLIGVLKGGR